MSSPHFYRSAQNYLQRLGASEYKSGLTRHIKSGKKAKTYRHNPSQYHRDLVQLLGDDNENDFLALKSLSGYASSMGV